MNKGQGHEILHEYILAAALKEKCYLTTYELSGLKGIHQNYKFCLKNIANTKVSQKHQSWSTVTQMSRPHHFVMQLLQSYRCIYVSSMMIVAAIVCEIQTYTSN